MMALDRVVLGVLVVVGILMALCMPVKAASYGSVVVTRFWEATAPGAGQVLTTVTEGTHFSGAGTYNVYVEGSSSDPGSASRWITIRHKSSGGTDKRLTVCAVAARCVVEWFSVEWVAGDTVQVHNGDAAAANGTRYGGTLTVYALDSEVTAASEVAAVLTAIAFLVAMGFAFFVFARPW